MAQGMVKEAVSKEAYHHRARKFRKSKCERCGSADRLHVHHKDDNYKNNDPANLETLCTYCHGKEHGPRRGNTFAGRQWVLKTDLAEIWVSLRKAMRLAKDRDPSLSLSIRDILHKHGRFLMRSFRSALRRHLCICFGE